MLHTERVRILISKSVLNLCLTVGIIAYPLPPELYLDYYKRALANQELYYNPICLTLLPI